MEYKQEEWLKKDKKQMIEELSDFLTSKSFFDDVYENTEEEFFDLDLGSRSCLYRDVNNASDLIYLGKQKFGDGFYKSITKKLNSMKIVSDTSLFPMKDFSKRPFLLEIEYYNDQVKDLLKENNDDKETLESSEMEANS